jgi:anti-repressor protein
MNQLISTNQNKDGEIIISGRELHEFLESNERYSKWFDRMKEYGFVEEVDFTGVQKSTLVNNGAKRILDDHHIKIDMAKEISMIQRNEKGKQARQYFLELERKWNSPDMVIKRAHEFLEKKVALLSTENLILTQQNKELKPKADYTDLILKNKGLVTISQIAKDYGMSGTALNDILNEFGVQYKQSGQWLLYAKHHDKGYTHSQTIDIKRSDGTPDVKMNTKWTQKGRLFIYDLLKREDILPIIERELVEA